MVHFRDCKQWKDENLAMSTTSDSAVKLYDHALHQMYSHTADESVGGTMGAIEKMLEADPDFVMGKVFDGAMSCMEGNARINLKTKEKAEHLKLLCDTRSDMNEREKLHCSAIVEWSNGDRSKACKIWDEILFSCPKDSLAISFNFLCNLYLGNSAMLRDGMARVLKYWENDPFYGYMLSRYAFGLEETNMFALADEKVKEGLSLIPTDSWGIHTVAHIREETCAYNDGIDFLRKTESDWSVNNSLSCHNYWHLGLYYIELGMYEEALTLYDDIIAPTYKKSGVLFNVNDGTQLLQRLEFEGVNVGDRWKDAYASYKPHTKRHMLCYDDAHMICAFMKSKINPSEGKDEFLDSMKEYLINGCGDNKLLTEEAGMDVFNGIMAYEEARYDDAVLYLLPVKDKLFRFGGSHAQRDLFELFLIQSCLRSTTKKTNDIGRGLMMERKLLKPTSPMTDRMAEKMMAAHV